MPASTPAVAIAATHLAVARLAAAALALVPGALAAQGADGWRRFDQSGNGYLSGTEVTACGCKAADADGDGVVMPDEYARWRGAAASTTTPAAWRGGDRVEAYVDGAWHPATVVRMGTGDEAGRVRVSLDGYTYGTSRIESLDPQRVRRRAATPAPVAASPKGLPAALPAGLYVCTTSYPALMTLGRLTLRGDGSYTGMSRDGTGRGGRYRYDAATGRVDWVGGLQGFTGQVSGTEVYRDTQGVLNVRVSYTARAGGNESSMDCYREGA
jgi:hypothetical protein